ncbi:MAG: DUF4347 domain-containing protein [Burkholderiaceae bacterium]
MTTLSLRKRARLSALSKRVPGPGRLLASAAPVGGADPISAPPRARIDEIAPRLLFSADVAVLAPEPQLATMASEVATLPPDGAAAADSEQVQRNELVVIDTAVADHQQLIQDFADQADGDRRLTFLILDVDDEGLSAIGAALAAGDRSFDAIHLVSHGDARGFELGATFVDADALRAHSRDVSAWAPMLAAGADIMIYGCDLASGTDGRALMTDLASLSGADVAASDDRTGAGGDWQLEVATGAIGTSALSSDWQGTLDLVPASGDTLVNDTGGGNHMTPSSAGQVATNGDNTVVVWENNGRIRYRVFGDGFDTGQLQIGNGGGSKAAPAVAMNAGGEFVIVWTDDDTGGNTSVFAARFDALGNVQTSAATDANGVQRVNTATSDDSREADVALRDDGSFLVVWTQTHWLAGTHDVHYRLFDSGGTGAAAIMLDLDASLHQQRHARVVWDGAGGRDRFGVLWIEDTAAGNKLGFREIDSAGATPSSTWELSNPLGGDAFESADMAVRSDGTLAWAAVAEDGSSSFKVLGWTADLLGTDGSGSLSFIDIGGASSNDYAHVAIAVDAADAAIVAWSDVDTDAEGISVFARQANAFWQFDSISPMRVPAHPSGDQLYPSVAAAGSQASIAWSGESAVDSNGTMMRTFDVVTPGLTILDQNGYQTTEDGAGNVAAFTLALTSPPSDTVIITIASSNTGEATTYPAALAFDASNWSTPQTFTVTGVRDGIFEHVPVDYQVLLSVNSLDPVYGLFGTVPIDMLSIDADEPVGPVADIDTQEDIVDENAAAGTPVGITTNAVDPNSGDGVQYFIDTPNGPFAVDAGSGVVTVADPAQLDHEVAATANVDIRAQSDDGSSSVASFVVTIANVNDPPTAAGSSILLQAGGNAAITTVDLGYADQDSDALAAIRVTTLPATGVLSLNGTAVQSNDRIPVADIDAGRLTYAAPVDAAGTNPTDFAFTVEDAGGAVSVAAATIAIDFNAPPRFDSHAGSTQVQLDHAENGVDLTHVTVADIDSTTITTTLGGDDAGLFTLDEASGDLRWRAAPDFESPTDLDADGIYQVTVTAADDEGGQASQAFSIRVTNEVEQIVLSAPGLAASDEDQPLAFDDALATTIDDPDLSADLQLTIRATRGTLAVGASPAQLDVLDQGAGVRLRGSAAELNLALAGLVYSPLADDNGLTSLTMQLVDRALPTSSLRTASATVAIQIAAVNDPPVIGGSGATAQPADQTLTLTPALLSATDIEQGASSLRFTIVQAPVAGSLSLNGSPLRVGESFTQADIEAGRVTYDALTGDAADETLRFSVSDGAGGLVDAQLQIQLLSVANGSSGSSGLPGAQAGAGESAADASNDVVGVPDSSAASDAGGDGPAASFAPPQTSGSGGGEGQAAQEPEAPNAAASVEAPSAPSGGGFDGSAYRRSMSLGDAQSRTRFEFETNRIADTAVVDGLSADRGPAIAQVDRIWLETPMAASLEHTFANAGNTLQPQLVFDQRIAASSIAVSTGVSIGYVIWLLRGGALLSSIIASMPAWRSIDPLPVLQSLDSGARADQDGESIESMLDAANREPEPSAHEIGPDEQPGR